MPFPTVTYTFANTTTADATQVNQDFTDLINGISDGTKNISVSAITAAGATNLQGAITFGASSSNDLTFNGSIASTIPVKTNTSFDIGSATLGMRSVYIGGSSTFTVRVLGATMASSYTLTLPPTTGTIGQFLCTDGTGVSTFRYPDKAKAGQTGTVLLTGDETLVPCDSSAGSFTVTLPAAASFTGKRYVIIKTDADTNLANKVTIAGNASELISGSNTTTLNTRYEAIEIVCDGTGWHIINRRIPSVWASYTLAITGASANPTTGTLTVNNAQWRRVGDSIEILYQLIQSTAGTAGTGNYLYSLPTGITLDTTKVSTSVFGTQTIGQMHASSDIVNDVAASTADGHVFVYDSTHFGLKILSTTTVEAVVSSAAYGLNNATILYLFNAKTPVSGWNG